MVAACSKSGKSEPGGSAKATEAKKSGLTAAWLGSKPGLPGPLASIKFPGAPSDKLPDSDLDDVRFNARNGAGAERAAVMVIIPASKKDLVVQAWGPGKNWKRGGDDLQVWFNPDAGVRAEVSTSGSESTIDFYAYTPVAKLFGDGTTIAALPDLANPPSDLPRTEWGLHPTHLSCKDSTCRFDIPFTAEGKADILAALEKKWGKPTPTETREFLNSSSDLYQKSNPRVSASVTEAASDGLGKISIKVEAK